MSNKVLSLGLLIVAAVIITVFGVWQLTKDDDQNKIELVEPSTQETTQPNSDVPSLKSFSLVEVATHNSADDCWTVINANVYDITSYIPRHPGGEEILRACGTDGTTLFEQRETQDGQAVGSGTPHSSSAASQLEALQTGILE